MNSSTPTWTEADSERAQQVWRDYQKEHDVSSRLGQAVGIDPATGRVWFGESAKEIFLQRENEGIHSPFYCLRVGADFYVRKGGHR
jgi:hypothetical protein